MSNYLEPVEDGLPIRDFGPWVAEKLDYLKRYIGIFENSMHMKPWRERHYIDLFAGTGKCQVAETRNVYLGSSLLALTTTHPFTHYYFVDKEPDNISVLRKRCDASLIASNVDCKTGDGNTIVKEIVEHILDVDRKFINGTWSSLNLAFLDPDGLELRWETVAALAQPSKMDLIIHYSQMGIKRPHAGQLFII